MGSRHRHNHRRHRPARDFFAEELVACKECDTPGKMVFTWTDVKRGYTFNDEKHQIAQRIGPELQPFVAGLSSDPNHFRGRGALTPNECLIPCILCCIIGPFALICFFYNVSQSNARFVMAKQKFLDSIHDMARRHDLQAYVSPLTSYFSFTDPRVIALPQHLVQQPMMMMGTPQVMPPPGHGMYQQQPAYAPYGQEMYQQQPAYAPAPDGVVPMMPPGFAQAPQGYAPQPQNGMYGAPPIETYDPMNVK